MRQHAFRMHGYTAQQLYDALNPGSGRCECGAPTKFLSVQKGYKTQCNPCNIKRVSKLSAETRRSKHERAWNSGKTKHDDASVAKIATSVKANIEARGIHWNKGRSKSTHQGIADAALKRSATMKESFASGRRCAWHSGRSAADDSRIARMGVKISGTLRRRNACRRRADIDELRRLITGASLASAFNFDITTYAGMSSRVDARCIACGNIAHVSWRSLLSCRPCRHCTVSLSSRRVIRLLDAPRRRKEWRRKLTVSRRLSRDVILARLARRASDFTWDDGVITNYTSVADHFDVTCRACGLVQQKSVRLLDRGSLCSKCYPPWTISLWQKEVADFVTSLGHNVIVNDRATIAPFELDIWIPSKKFAIECHGLYWHSDAVAVDPHAAMRKWELCNAAGVNLMQLFEDEWRDKRELVEAMIRHRLGMSRRLYARRCSVRELSVDEARSFLDENHIDGYVASTKRIGLVHDGQLVAVATSRRPRHAKWSGHVEVARLASARDVYVVGGASRLLSNLGCSLTSSGNKHVKLMAYVDTRLGGSGAAYESAGLTRVGVTGPRFWWTDFSARIDRFAVRADPATGRSEEAVASDLGVTRIWGPPNIVFACVNPRT